MFGSAVGRKGRALWAILAFLFALGFVLSAIMVRSERDAAFESAVERAREEAQSATDDLSGRQLTKPITGSSYDRVAAKIWKSVSSDGSIDGVTIWSSHGRILFSLNESRVGGTPPEMRSLITGIAKGSGSTRVLDGTVETFTPVTKSADGPVVVVQVDQPFAVVEAQTGGLWSMVRLGSAVGLAITLLLLGLTFVSSKGPVRAQEDAEPTRLEERQEDVEDEEIEADVQRPAEKPTKEKRVPTHGPTYGELFGLESDLGAGITAPAHVDGDVPDDAEVVMEAQEQVPAEQAPVAQPPAAQPAAEQVPVAQVPAEQAPAEELAPPSEEAVPALRAELDETADQLKALDADVESAVVESQESNPQWPEEFQEVFRDMVRGGDAQTQEMRQRREEFKNRAKQAELRLKKLDAGLHEAPSAPNAER
jgi:uncharacterized membrane-anchored protein YhcB (DUF1043 family)